MPKEITGTFKNGSSNNYHFVIKGLADKFEEQFTCIGKNTEKFITFSVPVEKEVKRIGENGEKITKAISYILKFIKYIIKSCQQSC